MNLYCYIRSKRSATCRKNHSEQLLFIFRLVADSKKITASAYGTCLPATLNIRKFKIFAAKNGFKLSKRELKTIKLCFTRGSEVKVSSRDLGYKEKFNLFVEEFLPPASPLFVFRQHLVQALHRTHYLSEC